MKTILCNCKNEIVINNSRFICLIYKINNIYDIENIFEIVKKEYKDATHYCYAYIIDNNYKSSDDGEPGGTAGMPILGVLKNNNLNYVLAIVIRYFGGIKLGTGGLVRAYTKSVTEALKNADIVNLINGFNLIIEFNYDMLKEIDYLLKGGIINNKEFNNKIIYDIDVNKDIYDKLNNNKKIIIIKKTNKNIIDNTY